jgi:O-Antigen ligase
MSNTPTILRSLIIYGLCLPVAIFVGYLLAEPMDMPSFVILFLVVFLPLVPVLLRWHHLLLIASWNLTAILFFLPGRPYVWIVMSLVSLLLSILQFILKRESKLLYVPSVGRPLIFLFLVVVMTASLTGGIGLKSFGSEKYGGRDYIMVLMAIVGYFAISCQSIPRGREKLYISVFWLSSVAAVIGSLAGFLPYDWNYIFLLFPVQSLRALYGGVPGDLSQYRFMGLAPAGAAVVWYGLARYGLGGVFRLSESLHFLPFRIRGGFQVNQPWRAGMVLVGFGLSIYSGFRSQLIFFAMMFFGLFFLERLYRSRALPFVLLVGILGITVSLPMASKLPPTIQRSLSFLPLDIDPIIRMNADFSNEWRLRMWRSILPMVPRYLLVGKGYSIDPELLSMSETAMERDNTETAILAGDYHNGPLTVLIPLGIWGALGFLWFLGAGFRVLYRNYRYGDPELHRINTFLFLYFVVKVLFYLFIYGSFQGDFFVFTGLVALSISANGGVRAPVQVVAPEPAFDQLRLARATP